MLILALESSAGPASAAICSDSELIGQYYQNSGLTHSRTLLAMTEALIKNLDITASEIDVIAVSRGPGSFTGVRIGVSAAKGIAWGLDKPVCGVSTLEAMACQTPFENTLICPVMDARRGQVYNAVFMRNNRTLIRLCEDRAISLGDLAADLRSYVLPPYAYSTAGLQVDGCQVCLVGDGALLSCKYLSDAGINCLTAPGLLHYQTAYGVALAAANAVPVPACELEPCYLRPSQAERERLLAGARITRP